MSDAETDAGSEAGRALVREVLIRPLLAAGLKRARNQSEATQAACLDHLIGQLDHMSADNLRTLVDVVMDAAAVPGPARGVWPAEVLILGWARGLQPRPFRLHRVVTSWLASIEGPQAEAGGWLVPLFRFLRQHHVPPTDYHMSKIKEQAREDSRMIGMIADRQARGVNSDQDRAWHAAYIADQHEARGYVDRGREGREGKAA